MSEETNDLPLDNEPGEPGAADSVADQAERYLQAQRKRGRPSAEAREAQASLADVRITTNEALARACRDFVDLADAAARHRSAAKAIKTIMASTYPEAVNSDDDKEHSGYVVVVFPEHEPADFPDGPDEGDRAAAFRFRPRNRYVPEETVEFKRQAGTSWRPLDVEKLEG